MILNLIPIGFFCGGTFSTYLTMIKKNELDEKIKNYPIYFYPKELNKIPLNNQIKVIAIPSGLINKEYLIGEISLEKIIPTPIYVKKIIRDNNSINNWKSIQVEKQVELKQDIKKQILFPKIYSQLDLDQNLLKSNKIIVLFDNLTVTRSDSNTNVNTNYKVLFDLYEHDIKKNIPTYYPDLIPNIKFYESVELKKNYLDTNKNLYLIVSNNNLSGKYYIRAMADSKEKIINQALKSDIEEYDFACGLSVGLFFSSLLSYLIIKT